MDWESIIKSTTGEVVEETSMVVKKGAAEEVKVALNKLRTEREAWIRLAEEREQLLMVEIKKMNDAQTKRGQEMKKKLDRMEGEMKRMFERVERYEKQGRGEPSGKEEIKEIKKAMEEVISANKTEVEVVEAVKTAVVQVLQEKREEDKEISMEVENEGGAG